MRRAIYYRYPDIGRYRANFVQTREHQIVNVADSMGCGVRNHQGDESSHATDEVETPPSLA